MPMNILYIDSQNEVGTNTVLDFGFDDDSTAFQPGRQKAKYQNRNREL